MAGEQRITKADIDAVADKLQSWADTLSDQERLVMGWILARAQAAGEPDVTGHLVSQAGVPFAAHLGRAAGLGLGQTAIVIERQALLRIR